MFFCVLIVLIYAHATALTPSYPWVLIAGSSTLALELICESKRRNFKTYSLSESKITTPFRSRGLQTFTGNTAHRLSAPQINTTTIKIGANVPRVDCVVLAYGDNENPLGNTHDLIQKLSGQDSLILLPTLKLSDETTGIRAFLLSFMQNVNSGH